MARIPVDLAIYTFFERCVEELKKNQYLLPDIWSGNLECDPLASSVYYPSEQNNAIKWFLNNKINILLDHRRDLLKYPCIGIRLTGSREMTDKATIGDVAFMPIGGVNPIKIQRPPTKIYSDFTPVAYDPTTGQITLPEGLDTYKLAPQVHMVVEKNTGRSFPVKSINCNKNFRIEPNSQLDLKDIYITPVTDAWNCHYGRIRIAENISIMAAVTSDPVELIWLSQLVEYCLTKFKYEYLEKRNMELSTWSCSGPNDSSFNQADKIFTREYNMSAQSEMSFIKSVHPRLAKTSGGIYIADGGVTDPSIWPTIKGQAWKMDGDKGRE